MTDKRDGWLLTRRQAIKLGTAGGAGFFLATKAGSLPRVFAQAVPGPGILDPTLIPKYVNPLVIPPAMPRADKLRPAGMGKQTDYYEIAVREFTQQILPATDSFGIPTAYPPTRVWSYCSALAPQTVGQGGTLHYPALTIEAKTNRPNRIKWINQLVDGSGNYLPHLLPIDQTLHWANPPGGDMHRDGHGMDGAPYTGPVPISVHVHGAHAPEHSDGYPEAWYLPAAGNIPTGYAMTGTVYDIFKGTNEVGRTSPLAQFWAPGSAVFEYPNDQRAATLWYHDHALGMTRANVYAGPAGFYILRGGPGDVVLDAKGNPAMLPGPAPKFGDLPGIRYYEIPIVIQDRSFKEDGSLFYPDNRAFFEGLEPNQLAIPFLPDADNSDIAPIWNPEFFGNTMVVNGYTWPFHTVENRRYRLRFLNGCDSRFLVLQFADPVTGAPAAGVDVWQIGGDQGYLAAPYHVTDPASVSPMNNLLLIAPAERADVIVDFTNVPAGTIVRLINIGPDEPFGGVDGMPNADPATTGQVMEFRVIRAVGKDATTPPAQLVLPAIPVQPAPALARQLSLNELMSMKVFVPYDPLADAFVLLVVDATGQPIVDPATGKYIPFDPAVHSAGKLLSEPAFDPTLLPEGVISAEFGPMAAFLGTMDPAHGTPDANGAVPLPWFANITETPRLGTSEIWELHNFTADAHPIHVHLVQFQVLDRQPIGNTDPALVRLPEPWETGLKDTVISYPGEVTRLQAVFDLPGVFVWHCHILSHEDNEMMRPFEVLP